MVQSHRIWSGLIEVIEVIKYFDMVNYEFRECNVVFHFSQSFLFLESNLSKVSRFVETLCIYTTPFWSNLYQVCVPLLTTGSLAFADLFFKYAHWWPVSKRDDALSQKPALRLSTEEKLFALYQSHSRTNRTSSFAKIKLISLSHCFTHSN